MDSGLSVPCSRDGQLTLSVLWQLLFLKLFRELVALFLLFVLLLFQRAGSESFKSYYMTHCFVFVGETLELSELVSFSAQEQKWTTSICQGNLAKWREES